MPSCRMHPTESRISTRVPWVRRTVRHGVARDKFTRRRAAFRRAAPTGAGAVLRDQGNLRAGSGSNTMAGFLFKFLSRLLVPRPARPRTRIREPSTVRQRAVAWATLRVRRNHAFNSNRLNFFTQPVIAISASRHGWERRTPLARLWRCPPRGERSRIRLLSTGVPGRAAGDGGVTSTNTLPASIHASILQTPEPAKPVRFFPRPDGPDVRTFSVSGVPGADQRAIRPGAV